MSDDMVGTAIISNDSIEYGWMNIGIKLEKQLFHCC
jgi:hypothetical protein